LRFAMSLLVGGGGTLVFRLTHGWLAPRLMPNCC
jgi:hypothetical protein